MRARLSAMGWVKRLAFGAASLTAMGTQVGCGLFGGGSDVKTLRASPSIPSGAGTVEATTEGNGNTRLSIRVEHLAPPARVAPDATVYVAWVQPGSAVIQNVGALSVNDDLEGHLDTVTPHKRFAIMITPEPSAAGSRPTHESVFNGEVDQTEDD
jgi:hypothetical protein